MALTATAALPSSTWFVREDAVAWGYPSSGIDGKVERRPKRRIESVETKRSRRRLSEDEPVAYRFYENGNWGDLHPPPCYEAECCDPVEEAWPPFGTDPLVCLMETSAPGEEQLSPVESEVVSEDDSGSDRSEDDYPSSAGVFLGSVGLHSVPRLPEGPSTLLLGTLAMLSGCG